MVELEYERLVEVLRWAFGERVVIEVWGEMVEAGGLVRLADDSLEEFWSEVGVVDFEREENGLMFLQEEADRLCLGLLLEESFEDEVVDESGFWKSESVSWIRLVGLGSELRFEELEVESDLEVEWEEEWNRFEYQWELEREWEWNFLIGSEVSEVFFCSKSLLVMAAEDGAVMSDCGDSPLALIEAGWQLLSSVVLIIVDDWLAFF